VRDVIGAAGWRIVLLASLGGTLEFFDFVIFGIFARDIGDTIFPNPTPLVSLIQSFAAFAVGYLARPIGGIVLSHFGDRYGRRRVFLVSIFVMSAATFAMGLVPSYAAWGAAASLLMVTLRLLQGFCLGGELPGALTYVVETARRQAAFVCGVVFACVTMGVAAATGLSLILRTWLEPEVMAQYGWRVAFVVGGLGGLVSFVLRRSLEESPEFVRIKALAARQPLREVARTHLSSVALGIACLAATAGFNGLFFSHLTAYMSSVLSYDARQAVVSQTVGVIVHALAIVGVGYAVAATRLRPRTLLCGGALALTLLALPFYSALAAKRLDPTRLMVMAGVIAAFVNGTFAVVLTDLFPTRLRFSGVALGFNVAFTIFSGTAPLVATSLVRSTGLSTAPAFVMMACGALSFAASLALAPVEGHVLGD